MNRFSTILRRISVTVICCCFGIIQAYADDSGKQMTMMTYNIQGHLIINSRQVDKIASVINSASPDVVAIQEVDQRFVKDCAAQLGTKTGMKSRFLITHKDYFGIVLLSKEEPLGIKTHLIVKGAGGGTNKPDPDDNRGIIIAEFPNYYFLSTHYSLNAEDRDVATAYIINFAKSVNKPVFLGGDLNVKETYRAMVTFKNNGFSILNDTKTFTYPSTEPTECIDFILGYNKSSISYKVIESGIADKSDVDLAAASDHLPLYVKIEFSNPTGNEQNIIDKKKIEVTKSGDRYLLTGINGIAYVKLYSITGELLADTYMQDGDELPLHNLKSGIVLVWLKNGDEVYTRKLIL
ncbi:endonuclease/exonuclease/phosphatase family protein [Bacteroides sp.]